MSYIPCMQLLLLLLLLQLVLGPHEATPKHVCHALCIDVQLVGPCRGLSQLEGWPRRPPQLWLAAPGQGARGVRRPAHMRPVCAALCGR